MSGQSTPFPVALYQGAQTSAAIAVDDASTSVLAGLDRSATTLWSQSGTSAKVEIRISIEGGPFGPFFFFTVSAQDKTNPQDTGNTATAQVSMPPGTGRQIQLILTITNGLVHTSVTASWQ